MELSTLSENYYRIERALEFLHENFRRQPTLKEIAASAYMSEYHFQRIFSNWVGISPKRFLQFLSKEYAIQLLEESRNMLDITFQTGLSSPGRLHDLILVTEAVTPGEYKSKGEGIEISCGFHSTPFGEGFLSLTDRGICGFTFVQNKDRQKSLNDLKKKWKYAKIKEDEAKTKQVIAQIFTREKNTKPAPLHLFLQGSNFQLKVWQALLSIPPGGAASYESVAKYIGEPKAQRAVGNAVGSNPIAFIIPCHRVIRKIGEFGNYASGKARKMAILGWEASRLEMGKETVEEDLVKIA